MLILDSTILTKHGPYIEFASLPAFIPLGENDWPKPELYREHVFFSWADSLSDLLCAATHSHLFFDPYAFIQHDKPSQIHGFSAELMIFTSRVASCPEMYFDPALLYDESSSVPMDCRTNAHLKADLIETLLFVSSQINQTARNKRCLAIVGI